MLRASKPCSLLFLTAQERHLCQGLVLSGFVADACSVGLAGAAGGAAAWRAGWGAGLVLGGMAFVGSRRYFWGNLERRWQGVVRQVYAKNRQAYREFKLYGRLPPANQQ
jgi:hypothetical protein